MTLIKGVGLTATITEAAVAVDRPSFDAFVRARGTALVRVAYLLTGDLHDAEDVVQAALAKAAVHWRRIGEPEAYIRRVIYTQAVSWWKVRRRRNREVLVSAPAEVADRGGGGPADVDARVVLAAALARLTPKQRAVLVLRFYEDRSESETAQMLGVGLGTVKSQTRHALRRLRELAPELAAFATDDSTTEGMVR